MNLIAAPRGELLRLVYDLIDENQALKSQIAELRIRLGEKDGKGKSPLPSFVKPNKKNPSVKMERKKREENFARKRDIPTSQVVHALEVCPDCGGILGKPSVSYKRQVIDLPQTAVSVTEHVICKSWCYHCRRRFAPNVVLNNTVLGNHRVGINLMGIIVTLRERMRLPVRVIKLYLSIFYNLSLSEGEIVSLLEAVARAGTSTYEECIRETIHSPVVCADETGHRQDGVNGYLWNFVSPTTKTQVLLYRKSRGQKVVKEVFNLDEDGNGFNGILVTDFYSSYNLHAGFHQRCWAHLLRDMHELEEKVKEENPQDQRVEVWAKKVKEIFDRAKAYSGPSPTLPIGLQAKERIEKEAVFKEGLREVCEPWVTDTVPMSGLCSRVMKYMPELFSFIRFPDVPPTNNLAERTLRHSVVQRKIFGGTRSPRGSETKAILGSLFGTWNLRSLNPYEQCRLLLLQDPCP